MGFLSYIIQYSNYDAYFYQFKRKIRLSIVNTLGILPLCILGLYISSSKITETLKLHRKKVIFFSYLSLYLLIRYKLFNSIGGGYKGIDYVFPTIFFFFGFYLLPLDNINPFLEKTIKIATNYTNGIYCMHYKIITVVKTKYKFKGNMRSCIIIYLISYFISFIGIKLFRKTKLKYLFI